MLSTPSAPFINNLYRRHIDMARVFNFSAGPSMLPESVLNKAADELLDYEGTGESVMEMSHRSKEYQAIIDQAEADLRTLMNIPDNYKVLFLQGGASTQFAAIPLNFMNGSGKADYIVSGVWSKKAAAEAVTEEKPKTTRKRTTKKAAEEK